jgi:hypothetical protein
MLMALLLPDPCDPYCPAKFKKEARRLLLKTRSNIDGDDLGLQYAILKFIGDFANWDLSADGTYLEAARGLIKAAHPEETPVVVDPFAGGGSIPLEALRLGCDAFASDLNPVACLINKVLLEDIPRHGAELAEELRRLGADLKKAAEAELAVYYPADPDGARPIAYLWARTVRCESPNCGAEIPLVRSFWLGRRGHRKRAIKYRVVKTRATVPRIEFDVFQPVNDSEVPDGTVARAQARCPCCGSSLMQDRVRAQLLSQNGGADSQFDGEGKRIGGATLLAVVCVDGTQNGRLYRAPHQGDYAAAYAATRALESVPRELLPDTEIPVTERRRISLPIYGMRRWGDLFTARQKIALLTFCRLVGNVAGENTAVSELLAMNISRAADYATSLCSWKNTTEKLNHTFGRQALPMMWDFAEVNLAGDTAANLDWIARVVERQGQSVRSSGQVQMSDACQHPMPDESVDIWFTDPPYYDSVPYAHLADFFYLWLRRSIKGSAAKWFLTPLTPKEGECVVDRPHALSNSLKTPAYFEHKLGDAMREGRRLLKADGVGCVVFAHKTTEGWEALVSGMLKGGWTVTASWPVSTEMQSRLTARDTASLASSVHLVCRPRAGDAPVGDWGRVLRELPGRVGDWIERLQREGIRGADLVFACIGPALEIYSRYSKVVDPQEREIPLGGDAQAKEPHLRGYLAYVWEIVGRTALEQVLGTAEAKARNGAAGALEEDARLTALFLWTIQATPVDNGNGNGDTSRDGGDTDGGESEDDEENPAPKRKSGGFSLIYDVVRRFAQPLGIHLEEWEGRITETEKGVVRLIPVLDRAEQLFGEAGASLAADRIEAQAKRNPQTTFDFMVPESAVPEIKGRGKRKQPAADLSEESLRHGRGATTLDRVHAAMLLQSSGQPNALRALLKSEVDRGPDFVRLANALSALYPPGSDEKRLVDAMLLAVPR